MTTRALALLFLASTMLLGCGNADDLSLCGNHCPTSTPTPTVTPTSAATPTSTPTLTPTADGAAASNVDRLDAGAVRAVGRFTPAAAPTPAR